VCVCVCVRACVCCVCGREYISMFTCVRKQTVTVCERLLHECVRAAGLAASPSSTERVFVVD
jgi:hypothetical protein